MKTKTKYTVQLDVIELSISNKMKCAAYFLVKYFRPLWQNNKLTILHFWNHHHNFFIIMLSYSMVHCVVSSPLGTIEVVFTDFSYSSKNVLLFSLSSSDAQTKELVCVCVLFLWFNPSTPYTHSTAYTHTTALGRPFIFSVLFSLYPCVAEKDGFTETSLISDLWWGLAKQTRIKVVGLEYSSIVKQVLLGILLEQRFNINPDLTDLE